MDKCLSVKMHIRIYNNKETKVVGVCEKELLGKIHGKGNDILDLKNYENFYKGKEVSVEEATELMKNADSVNLVGEKAIEAARKVFDVNDKRILSIGGVKHLQIYNI